MTTRFVRVSRFSLRIAVAALVVVSLGSAGAQGQDPIDRIREADLRADLFTLASDAMRGREAGTVDELNASMWVADRAREAGLLPAGDNGTYFQFFPLERQRVSASSPVSLGGKALQMGRDVFTDAIVLATVDATVVVAAPDAIASAAIAGKALVVRYAPAPGPMPMPSQSSPNAASGLRVWMRGIQRAAAPQNPAAIVAIVPDQYEDQWDRTVYSFPRGTYGLDPDGTAPPRVVPRGVPVLYVRESALGGPVAADARLVASISTDTFQFPSVNIVAKVPGSDPALASEYVLFSAHQDHDGVRYPVNGDAIWNGADDNASTAVALLAIGRAVSAAPLRRSGLFVWHGSEERGLMGSRWYVKHPTVPLASIVACLNGDMIGRNAPDTAALLGAMPPHRNSAELVQTALDANAAVTKFTVDSSWDDPQHPEGWYYRSDHLSYARAGVPALFFTTLLHADYHTPADNPDRVDTAKLTRMTKWMYATGRAVGNADRRPAVDPNFKLERCRDSTGNYCGGSNPTSAPAVAAPAPLASPGLTTVSEGAALQREVLAALSGHTEIRPGVRLADRFSPENRAEARTYLAAQLTRLGLEPKRHDYSATGENVYAVLSSGKPNAETVVLGAHYDSVRGAPGANDDGTGVAAVLGVALEMSRVPSRSRDIMVVFFDEEERGLVGSKAFAQMLKDQNVNVHSVHTIDQLGWDSNGNRAVEIELPYERAMELYQAASDLLTPPIPLLATSETGSDHQAFRRLGFKAVGVTEEYRHHDTTPFYHKPGDTFETVNFDYLTSSTRLIVEVMKALTK